LDQWARKIAAWGRDVFVYFGDEVKDEGPFLAQDLQKRFDMGSGRKKRAA
jgi:hypothetical protein